MEDKIYERAYKDDVTALEVRFKRLDEETKQKIESTKSISQGAERLATRLADDALAGQEDLRQ